MRTTTAPPSPGKLYVARARAKIRSMTAHHDPARFGKRLVELRERRGWRQSAAATLAGIDRRYLSKLENPGHDPKRPSVSKILDLARGWSLTSAERDELLGLAGYERAQVPAQLRGAFMSPHELTNEELRQHIAVMQAIVRERELRQAQERAAAEDGQAAPEETASNGS